MSTDEGSKIRPVSELSESGLLWLINKTTFHPRGFALALAMDDGVAVGWEIQGDGTEPWSFEHEVDIARFLQAEATLAALKPEEG